MARSLSLVSLLLFFFSGCVTVNGLPETSDKEISQPVDPQASVVASEKQVQPVVSDSPTQEPVANETTPANKSLSKVQIQVIQDLLKASGFDPGPIDGILGPKTRAALHQYQSGCAMLTNLLGTSDKEILQADTQPIKATTPAKKSQQRSDPANPRAPEGGRF
jgi:peptidoglycan hydrolase-like protein with peptidoglycan-binding domain